MIPPESLKRIEQQGTGIIARQNRTHLTITVGDLRRHIRQVCCVAGVFSLMLLAMMSIVAVLDLHAMRHLRVDELAEEMRFREGLFTRLDSLGWRMDTQAQETGSMAKYLRDALRSMGRQVQASTAVSAKTATATTTIAAEAVKATTATTQLAAQVADQAQPVVNVEVPKVPPAPVVVQAPATAQPAPRQAPPTRANTPERSDDGAWQLLKFWRWGKHARNAERE